MKGKWAVVGALAAALLAVAVLRLLADDDSARLVPAAHPSQAASLADSSTLPGVDASPIESDPSVRGTVEAGSSVASVRRREDAPEARAESEGSPTGALTGHILDERGAPVPWPELVLRQGTGDERILAADLLSLEPDGRFRIELAPGAWSVFARASEHCDSEPASVRVPAGGEATPQRLVLARQGILRGSVQLPSEWLSQLPRTFQVVLEVSADEPPSLETMDDEPEVRVRRQDLWIGPNRTFELRGNERGLYRLRLEVPRPGGNWVSEWTQTWLEPGDVREGIRLSCLKEAELALQGRILDDLGEPVEGASIETGAHLATSDATGRFELRGLDLGEHSLVVTGDAHASATVRFEFVGEPLSLNVELARAVRTR